MIHGGIEGFDGGVNGRLDADKNSDPKGDPYHGKNGSPFMVVKVTEGNVFEEMKENHGQNPNVKVQMSNECQNLG
jgi:hypothetical protein